MIVQNIWETLLHDAALLPIEKPVDKKDEAVRITVWKRIAAQPFVSVRTLGLMGTWKWRWEEMIK